MEGRRPHCHPLQGLGPLALPPCPTRRVARPGRTPSGGAVHARDC
ncbi:hypothetical protein A176_004642 [Myxococcus hansupus]|uniref:Uncharacterized protein n=1 Tax=Pseudomyxococcus hansupus TaxID=1297742 RepID=A0A0H4X251_9BACT|nr:hypothetical protein A176_004642 [Myxococcus hansupus]